MARFLSILLCIAVAVALAAGIYYPPVEKPIGPCETNDISKTEMYSNRFGRWESPYIYCTCAGGEEHFAANDTITSYATVSYRIYVCGAPTSPCSGAMIPVTDSNDGMQCTCGQYKYFVSNPLGWHVRCK